MIEYQLKDKDGNIYYLNGDTSTLSLKHTVTLSSDRFTIENKISERSYLPGAERVGQSRLKSRNITLKIETTNEDTSNYRQELNELIYFINKTEYIVDTTNSMELKVTIDRINIDYQEGGLKLFSTNTFEFRILNPFWESLNEITYSGSSLANTITEQEVTNNGFLEAPLIFTLTASEATSSVQLYLTSNSYGIQIDDGTFGTAGNGTMIIDCNIGDITIGSININNSIVNSTGFFSLPVGSDTINILATKDMDYEIKFRERYFI